MALAAALIESGSVGVRATAHIVDACKAVTRAIAIDFPTDGILEDTILAYEGRWLVPRKACSKDQEGCGKFQIQHKETSRSCECEYQRSHPPLVAVVVDRLDEVGRRSGAITNVGMLQKTGHEQQLHLYWRVVHTIQTRGQ